MVEEEEEEWNGRVALDSRKGEGKRMAEMRIWVCES